MTTTSKTANVPLAPGEAAFMASIAKEFEKPEFPPKAGASVSFKFNEMRSARGVAKKGLASVAAGLHGAGGMLTLTVLGAAWIKTHLQAPLAASPAQTVGKHDNLPALPAGWHYESHGFEADVIHVVWPEHGAISVRFARRTLASGWTIPNPASRGAALKSGKGWKASLVIEAVDMLNAVWASK